MEDDDKLFELLCDALVADYDELALYALVGNWLHEDLNRISEYGTIEDRVDQLVRWLMRAGRERQLVAACFSSQPSPQMTAVHSQLFADGQQSDRLELTGLGNEMRHVFVGHSQKDVDLAQKLASKLEDAGLTVLVCGESDAEYTQRVSEIEHMIRRTQCVIILCSPEARQSRDVDIAVRYAQALGRHIFGVLVRGFYPMFRRGKDDALPLSLFTKSHVLLDAKNDFMETVTKNLMPQVIHFLELVGFAPSASDTGVAGTEYVHPREASIKTDRIDDGKGDAAENLQTLRFSWITIPAGSFLMGSDSNQDPFLSADNRYGTADELPQHEVTLPQFCISRYPITNRQYKIFVDAIGCAPPPHWKNGRIPNGLEEHPVQFVSWYDANAFCAWASETCKYEVRLPSEAEWEKAARGDDGRLYPWGNEYDPRCRNRWPNHGRDTIPVGYFSPAGDSPYGVADMGGLLNEWTNSKDFSYPYQVADGREDQEDRESCVTRGSFFAMHIGCVVLAGIAGIPWIRTILLDFELRNLAVRPLLSQEKAMLLDDPACVEMPIVALTENQVVGFAGLRIVPNIFYPGAHAEITALFVEEPHRRQGIASAPMRYAEEIAQSRSAKEIVLHTSDDNQAARKFYAAMGYGEWALVLGRELTNV